MNRLLLSFTIASTIFFPVPATAQEAEPAVVDTVVRLPDCGTREHLESGVGECKAPPGTIATLDRGQVNAVNGALTDLKACSSDLAACRADVPPATSGGDSGVGVGTVVALVVGAALVGAAAGVIVDQLAF